MKRALAMSAGFSVSIIIVVIIINVQFHRINGFVLDLAKNNRDLHLYAHFSNNSLKKNRSKNIMNSLIDHDYKNIRLTEYFSNSEINSSIISSLRQASRRGSYVDMIRFLEEGLLPYLKFLVDTSHTSEGVDVSFICGTAIDNLPANAGPSKLRKIWRMTTEAHHLKLHSPRNGLRQHSISSFELSAYVRGLKIRSKCMTAILMVEDLILNFFEEGNTSISNDLVLSIDGYVICAVLDCFRDEINRSPNVQAIQLYHRMITFVSSALHVIHTTFHDNSVEAQEHVNHALSATFDLISNCSEVTIRKWDLVVKLFSNGKLPISLDQISFVKLLQCADFSSSSKISERNLRYGLLKAAIHDNIADSIVKDEVNKMFDNLLCASKDINAMTLEQVHCPLPNSYSYAYVIQNAPLHDILSLINLFKFVSSCSLHGEVVGEIKIYEAALLACTRAGEKDFTLMDDGSDVREREEMAMQILSEIDSPSTNVYNLVLSCVRNDISLPRRLISQMYNRGVARSVITYRNAILGSAGYDVDLVNLAVNDASLDLDTEGMQLILTTLLYTRLHTHSPRENAVWRLFNNYNTPLNLVAVKLLLKSLILSKQADYAVYAYFLVSKKRISLAAKHLSNIDPIFVDLMLRCDIQKSDSLASYCVHQMLCNDMNTNCIILLLPELSLESEQQMNTYIDALKHLASVNMWPDVFTALERLYNLPSKPGSLKQLHQYLFRVLAFNPGPRNTELSQAILNSILSRSALDTEMTLSCWKYYLSLQKFDTIINCFYTYILSDEYRYADSEQLGGVLSIVVKRLCKEFQSAWALRSLIDFVEWNNIPPPIGSLATIFNSISSLNSPQATEIITLCHSITSSVASFDKHYCNSAYTAAITALYNCGAYDDADELYLVGVSSNNLPWPLRMDNRKSVIEIDLHGMSSAIAHSFVRCALKSYEKSGSIEGHDIQIITGKGIRSKRKYRPILRPEVQKMLSEEFYPPINTSTVRKNMGALVVNSSDVQSWLDFQKGQTAKRMLVLADILKTPIERLATLRSMATSSNNTGQ